MAPKNFLLELIPEEFKGPNEPEQKARKRDVEQVYGGATNSQETKKGG